MKAKEVLVKLSVALVRDPLAMERNPPCVPALMFVAERPTMLAVIWAASI